MMTRELAAVLLGTLGLGACGTSAAIERRGAVLARHEAREVVQGPGVIHAYTDDAGARLYRALATGHADDCERARVRAMPVPALPMGERVTVVLAPGETLCLLGSRRAVELMWHFVPDPRWPLAGSAHGSERQSPPRPLASAGSLQIP